MAFQYKQVKRTQAETESDDWYVFEKKLKRIMAADLKEIENALLPESQKSENELASYFNNLKSKYKEYENYFNGFNDTQLDRGVPIRAALLLIAEKFRTFIKVGLPPVQTKNRGGISFNPTIQATASAQVNNTISITFENVIRDVDNMTNLTKSEVDEIKSKIEELEQIVNSKDHVRDKWDKAKGFLEWVSTKGFDIGMKTIPLLLKIGEGA